jgi:D-glycero-alpha-D-manno-heptose 1-phosphate guanylyltransferase
MEIIILAGGMGTRLQGVVNNVPKPMAPIQGKPFLDYLLKWITDYPVSKIIFSVGHKADVIKEHYGNVFNSIPVSYAEENQPLGTGGAILNALKYTIGDNVLIVNGDTYFPINLTLFRDFHIATESNLSVALKEMVDFERYGTVSLAIDTVVGFKEKQPLEKGLINGGIYFLKREFLTAMQLPVKFSFEQEVLEKEAATGNLKATIFNDTFIDIGVPEDYKKACEQL